MDMIFMPESQPATNPIEITLQKKESVLDKREFKETIDVVALNRLIASEHLKVLEDDDTLLPPSMKAHYENEKVLLEAYRKKYKDFKKKQGYVPVKYKMTSAHYGRVYPDKALSLCSFRKALRHTLAKDYYEDIDIKNCHPVILLQICQSNGIQCDYLARYVEQRSAVLQYYSQKYGCTEDDIKTLFIRIIYFGSIEKWARDMNITYEREPFFEGFKKDIERITDLVMGHNPEMVKELKRTDKKNDKGRVLSYYCQEWERRILEVVYDHLLLKQVVSDNLVLCFDGLMIPKNAYNPDILQELSQVVFERLKFKVDFVNKEMNMFYTDDQLPRREETPAQSVNVNLDESELDHFNVHYLQSLETYDEKKAYFEKFFCKVISPDPMYLFEVKDVRGDSSILMWSEKNLRDSVGHIHIEMQEEGDSKATKKPFINLWLKDDNLRCYNKLDFKPMNVIGRQEQTDFYNLFSGYNPAVDTECEYNERILAVFHLIGKELCGGHQEHYDFLLKYIAHMIQKPDERIPLAFIIKGKQGTGKNVWLNAVGNLLNKKNYISSANPKDFFGEYAEGFYHKLLVNINECEGKDTFDFEGRMKSFITEDTITLNPKFVRPTTIQNYARLIIFTNKPNPISIDVKSKDRRYVVFQTTDALLDKTKYGDSFWTQVVNHFKKPQFISCLYKFFNTMDIEGFNFVSKRPITEAYKEMCRLYAPTEALFFEHFIDNCRFTPNISGEIQPLPSSSTDIDETPARLNSPWYKKDFKIQGTHIFHEYIEWAKSRGFHKDHSPSIKVFYNKLTELELPIQKVKNSETMLKFVPQEVYDYISRRRWIGFDDYEEPTIVEDTDATRHLFEF